MDEYIYEELERLKKGMVHQLLRQVKELRAWASFLDHELAWLTI